MANINLTYLFECAFDDGDIIFQDASDRSLEIENGSQFSDVMKKIQEGKKVVWFAIQNHESGDRWGVDLKSGIFHHNGIKFISCSEQNLPDPNPDFELIYFRQVRIHANFKDGEYQNEVGREVVYYFGWKCNIGGKVYQSLIGVE